MKHILTTGAPVLERLARSSAVLAFDFDGTLAPIVRDRRRARMRATTRALLHRAATLYPCAVISGRSRGDVAGRVADLPIRHIVGNHGIDHGDGAAAIAAHVDALVADLRPLCAVPGVELEHKRYSLAIHYRNAARRGAARRTIAAALAALGASVRTVAGKMVFDVLPRGAPDKAVALAAIQAAERAETALYIGDDRTDEDVFRSARSEHLVPIRVGASARSAARFFVRDQREVDRLLVAVIELRSPRP